MRFRLLRTTASWLVHRVIYRTECIKTTWSARLAALVGSVLLVLLTNGLWSRQIARSLLCSEQSRRSDAILIENFDPNYLLFERAQALYQAGLASKVFVPIEASLDGTPSRVSDGVARVMAGVARLSLPSSYRSRNQSRSRSMLPQIGTILAREHVRTLTVVTPAFRSRRSYLVYLTVLSRAGIDVSCVPVFGLNTVENWPNTWHGIQEVAGQFIKLRSYRFYVLPAYASGWL